MKICKNNFQERGTGLLETLLAIAIVVTIMPFAYNGVLEMSNGIADASESKRITAWHNPVMAYVRKNQADWPSIAQIEFDEEEVNIIDESAADSGSLRPYAGFIDKRTDKGGVLIDAYLAFRPDDAKEMRVAKIARLIGSDAAIVADGGEATSAAGWSISSDVFNSGDLIYRISDILGEDETYRYLHRTYLDDLEMNTMRRDLDMAKHNLFDANVVEAQSLNAVNGNVWFAETPELSCAEVYFPEGASIDASKAAFNSINVNGDASGFRKIVARKFKGFGVLAGTQWSSRGDVVTDSATITGALHVQRDMVVRSESARSITGFAGVRAHSAAVPYLGADQLAFASGFGLVVSSELLYSTSSAPVNLGGWEFPSDDAPEFSGIILRNAGGQELGGMLAIPGTAKFAPIMAAGWKDKRQK